MAWDATSSSARLAASRAAVSRSSIRGRMASSRRNAAPLEVRIASLPGSGSATNPSGSMLKVRITLGYRLLKSNTQTLSCMPVTGSRTCPPACAADTRESLERTVGATIPRLPSSER